MNNIIKNGFKLTGIHALGILLTYVLMAIFSFITNLFIFSIISGIVYFWLLYMAAWHEGKRDSKSTNGNASAITQLKASIIPSVIPLIFIILIAAKVWTYTGILAKFWYMMFLGFYGNGADITVLSIFVSGLILPIATVIGYTLGLKNISFSENFKENRRRKREKLLQEKEKRIRMYKENK